MESPRDLIDWATMMIDVLGVLVTAVAAAAAITAGLYAKAAWESQVSQENNSQRQLTIAQEQEGRALAVYNRERRVLSPDWLILPMDEGTPVVFHSYGDLIHSLRGYAFWQNSIAPDSLRQEIHHWVIPLIDRKEPKIKIRSCRAWWGSKREVRILDFQKHEPFINSRIEGPGVMLILDYDEIPESETTLFIRFETESGFIDTQEFMLRVNLVATTIHFAELRRLDPESV